MKYMRKSTTEADQPFQLNVLSLRLPRLIEAHPRGQQVLRILTTQTRPLWPETGIEVPMVMLSSKMGAALRSAHNAGYVVRSLENAERMLATEERGLGLVDRHSGVPRGVRVSRLLVLADDGAERFYRQVERLLRCYGPRVLAVRLDADADALGKLLFGTNGRARLLMLNHKEAVSTFLLSMTDP
ncbi:MAG: hypothetical protein U9N82_03855 [Thermodesulfobacteriota bacterium]|nr:hypothetical protein [Thermodesulfobacteriota bacterium]